MNIFSFTCNAFGKPKCTYPDDRRKTAGDRSNRLEERVLYHEGRSVRYGWSIVSVTLPGGLADVSLLQLRQHVKLQWYLLNIKT